MPPDEADFVPLTPPPCEAASPPRTLLSRWADRLDDHRFASGVSTPLTEAKHRSLVMTGNTRSTPTPQPGAGAARVLPADPALGETWARLVSEEPTAHPAPGPRVLAEGEALLREMEAQPREGLAQDVEPAAPPSETNFLNTHPEKGL